jgi:hypothetical protein
VKPFVAAGPRDHPEPNPERGYYRSDHFSFAKLGVPMLAGESGEDLLVGGKAAGHKAREDYTTNRYHKPQDEYAQLELGRRDRGSDDLLRARPPARRGHRPGPTGIRPPNSARCGTRSRAAN